MGQNGRSVTIISCDEGEEQGTGPNGEILHNKVFRDGKADEPNVFSPEQYSTVDLCGSKMQTTHNRELV